MGKDPKFELKQHLNDKANTAVRCVLKAAGEARKEACIEHVFTSVEAQEAKINSTQKVVNSTSAGFTRWCLSNLFNPT